MSTQDASKPSPPNDPWPNVDLRSTGKIRMLEKQLDVVLQAQDAKRKSSVGKVVGIASVTDTATGKPVIVAALRDGAVFMFDDRAWEWAPMPSVPGTDAANADRAVDELRAKIREERAAAGLL